MQHIFWMIQAKLAGRCGPDRQPWKLAELRSAGFSAVLSVNDGVLCHPEDFDQLGMAYACIALPPHVPPRSGDADHCMNALPRAYSFVLQQLTQGHKVLVHCSSGKDRTGLFLAYFLVRAFDLPAKVAINKVLEVRPTAYTAEGWLDFTLEVLEAAGPNLSLTSDPACIVPLSHTLSQLLDSSALPSPSAQVRPVGLIH